jgi:para-nitrobenzyl esterase
VWTFVAEVATFVAAPRPIGAAIRSIGSGGAVAVTATVEVHDSIGGHLMRGTLLAAALLVTLPAIACASGAAPAADRTVTEYVHTRSGALHGVRDGDVLRFRDVPYARPPQGALRWAPPEPVRPWPGVRPATRPGPPCPQTGEPPQGSTDEDCLHLDVTVPATRHRGPRPVMVWLHGGGFSTGTGTEYDPRRLAVRGDVVVVTVDFRLGVLGNLAVPGMTDGGSYGLQDQRAALRWIRRNAAAFGGDGGNVTLFGQSGGAVAVCGQLASPAARGLFDRAILQSGSCGTTLAANAAGPDTPAFGAFWRPLADARRTGTQVAARLGCPARAGMLACLRRVPVARLLPETGAVTAAAFGSATLPEDPRRALRDGTAARIPVLSGHTADEQRMVAGVFALLGRPITAGQYPGLLTAGFGANATKVAAE